MNLEFVQSVAYYIISNDLVAEEGKRDQSPNLGPALVDFDANLLHKDVDIKAAISTALGCGVKWFVVPGSNLQDSASALELSTTEVHVLAATAGVHPYNTESTPLEESISILEHMILSSSCRAVGECGLDYSQGFPDRTFQIPWFKAQVDIAAAHGKPLYLHERLASSDFIAILRDKLFPSGDFSQPVIPCVVHCFTSPIEVLVAYLQMGFYIGLTGHIMTLSSDDLRVILSIIPSSRLVVETDAPYMGFKGCRKTEQRKKDSKYPNVPAALSQIVRRIAEHSEMDYDSVVRTTTENSFRFFGVRDK